MAPRRYLASLLLLVAITLLEPFNGVLYSCTHDQPTSGVLPAKHSNVIPNSCPHFLASAPAPAAVAALAVTNLLPAAAIPPSPDCDDHNSGHDPGDSDYHSDGGDHEDSNSITDAACREGKGERDGNGDGNECGLSASRPAITTRFPWRLPFDEEGLFEQREHLLALDSMGSHRDPVIDDDRLVWEDLPFARRGYIRLMPGRMPPPFPHLQRGYMFNNFLPGGAPSACSPPPAAGGAPAEADIDEEPPEALQPSIATLASQDATLAAAALSCWKSVWGLETDHAPARNIAYGGVLNTHTRVPVRGVGANTTADHPGVLRALEFAIGSVIPDDLTLGAPRPGAGADAVSSDSSGTPHPFTIQAYELLDAFLLELRATTDGHRHMLTSLIVAGKHQVLHRPVYGRTYFLRVKTRVAAEPHSPARHYLHHLALFQDMKRGWVVNRHTFRPAPDRAPSTSDGSELVDAEVDAASGRATTIPAGIPSRGDTSSLTPPTKLVLGVFNVWNSNPPLWLYNNPAARWARYRARIEYLTRLLNSHAPDIIALQEVRYDSLLGSDSEHAQIHHLRQLLPGYQHVFQPANVYFHQDVYPSHDEEGCAIFSKHPIIHSDHMLLSRDTGDREDEHQRVVLHAAVELPCGTVVDVYTTHLSLSETARNRTVLELWTFVQASRVGHFQIIAGDMNAEPDSAGLQFLQGLADLAGQRTTLHDAWLALHPEPEPRSTDPSVRYNALTFPSDNPVKRIDLVLVGTPDGRQLSSPEALDGDDHGRSTPNHTHADRPTCAMVVDGITLIGQDPLPGFGGPSADTVGMVHRDSYLYASDHRGLIANFTLLLSPDRGCSAGSLASNSFAL